MALLPSTESTRSFNILPPTHFAAVQFTSCSKPRMLIGNGVLARLPAELSTLQISCPLIVSSPSCASLAKRVQGLIPQLDSRFLKTASLDDTVTLAFDPDAVISVGSASALELATDIGMRRRIPHICIPTTYDGSDIGRRPGDTRKERDKFSLGNSYKGRPKKMADKKMEGQAKPQVIIYDLDLTSIRQSTKLLVLRDTELVPDEEAGDLFEAFV